MPVTEILRAFTAMDGAALAFLLLAWGLIGWHIEHPPKSRPSVSVLMAQYRRDWMQVFAARDPRIFDSQIIANLRQGTTFLASTSLIALGGVLAVLGNTDPLANVADDFATQTTPDLVWEVKLLTVALFLVSAFLRFIWASRIFGYCAVVMASVPNDPSDPATTRRAASAGELNIRAAANFNRGLRAMYFALASVAWVLGPVALIAAVGVTLWVLWTREFASMPRQIILGDGTSD